MAGCKAFAYGMTVRTACASVSPVGLRVVRSVANKRNHEGRLENPKDWAAKRCTDATFKIFTYIMIEKLLRYFGTNGLRLFSLAVLLGMACVAFDNSPFMSDRYYSPYYPFAQFATFFTALMFLLAIVVVTKDRKRQQSPLLSIGLILFSILGCFMLLIYDFAVSLHGF